MEHRDGKDNGADRAGDDGKREAATEMDETERRVEREVDERWSSVKVVSIDCVVVCTRLYCVVTTLYSARRRRGGCLSGE